MDVDYLPSDCGSSDSCSLFGVDSGTSLDSNNNNDAVRDSRRSKFYAVKQKKLGKIAEYEREKDDHSTISRGFNSLPTNRSSLGLFPRQNSGMNVILESTLGNEQSAEGTNILSSGNIRNSYDLKPLEAQPKGTHQPLLVNSSRPRLTSILYEQMKALEPVPTSGSTQPVNDSSPRILNRAFFGSVHDTVRKMKEPRNSPIIIDETSIDEQDSDRMSEGPQSQKKKTDQLVIPEVVTDDSISKTSRSTKCTSRLTKSKAEDASTEELSNINLTLQFNGTKLTGIRSTDCTKFVKKKPSSRKSDLRLKVDSSEANDTPGIVSKVSLKGSTTSKQRLHSNSRSKSTTEGAPQDDGDTFSVKETAGSVVSGAKGEATESETELEEEPQQLNLISSALCLAGDSVTTLFKLVTNIVPIEGRPPTEEEIEARKDAIGVYVMGLLGVSEETRTSIYQEACDEIETLKDVSVGTVDTLSNLFKWAIGKQEAREELKYKTKAFCSMSSEVDMNSDVWNRLNRNVETSVDLNELEVLAELEKLSEMEKLNDKSEKNTSPQLNETSESDQSIPETSTKTHNNEPGDLHSYAFTVTQEEPMSTRSLSCIPEEDEVTSSCGKHGGGQLNTESQEIFMREINGYQETDDEDDGLLKANLDTRNLDDTLIDNAVFDSQVTDVEEEYFVSFPKKVKNEERIEKNLFLLKRNFSDYITHG